MSKGKFKCELCERNDAEVQWFNHKNEELYICNKCRKIADGEFCSLFFEYVWYMTTIMMYKNIRTMTEDDVEKIKIRLSFISAVMYFLSVYEDYVLGDKIKPVEDGIYEIPIKGTNSKDLFNYVFVCDPVNDSDDVKTFKFGFVKRAIRKKTLKDSIGVELSFSKAGLDPDVQPVVDDVICSLISDKNFKIAPIWMTLRPLYNTTADDMMYIMSFAHENLIEAGRLDVKDMISKKDMKK